MTKIKVLHIDSEQTWRGGENQMRLLIEGSKSKVESHLACPKNSVAAKRLHKDAKIFPAEFSGFGVLNTAFKIHKYCLQEQIQVLDCQTSKAHSVAILVKMLNPKLKLVVHRRVDFALKSGWPNRKKYLSPLVDCFVPISEAIAGILKNYGIAEDKINTVRSAVDPAPFIGLDKAEFREKLSKEIGFDPKLPLIANVAYHTEQKGMPTLVKGLAELKKSGQNFICLLAGEGELTPSLKALSAELGLQDCLKFLGIRKDVANILSAADIFALPSNYEGLGTSILDALHSNCAVAASRVGGIPEMIIHQETGLLSDVGDYKCLGANLKALIDDSGMAQGMAQAGRELALERFSIDSMVSGNIAVYKDLLK